MTGASGPAIRPTETGDDAMNATDVVASGLSAPGRGNLPLAMFWSAHFVVKFVMLGLLAASVWCWAIIIDKTLLYSPHQQGRWTASRRCSGPASRWRSSTARSPSAQTSDMAAVFVAAMREWKRSLRRLAAAPSRASPSASTRCWTSPSSARWSGWNRRLLVLATIGSSAPFIGLFGTVWGIMTSFRSIAASKNTSLAVVAPGIAEALFATAIGLFAAIPAVIAYNKLQAEAAKQQARLEGFADEFSAILSRQIDERIAA